jgi:hypothetical protein
VHWIIPSGLSIEGDGEVLKFIVDHNLVRITTAPGREAMHNNHENAARVVTDTVSVE